MNEEKQSVIVFNNLVEYSEFLGGESTPMSINAKPFSQKNAQGDLKKVNSFEDIINMSTTSGQKIATAFSV